MTDPPPPPPSSFGTPPPASSPDVGAAISYGWKKFQENVGPLIAIILAPVAVLIVLELIGAFVVRGFVGLLFFSALALLLAMIAYLGIFNSALMVTSGQTVEFGKAFQTDRWGEWIVFAFVFGLFVGVGAIFCGIGALIVLAFFGLAPYYFLDQRKSLGDAFSASLEATRANAGVPLAIALTVLVGVLGIILCYVGALVTMPIAYIGVGFLYRHINNQPVAA